MARGDQYGEIRHAHGVGAGVRGLGTRYEILLHLLRYTELPPDPKSCYYSTTTTGIIKAVNRDIRTVNHAIERLVALGYIEYIGMRYPIPDAANHQKCKAYMLTEAGRSKAESLKNELRLGYIQ